MDKPGTRSHSRDVENLAELYTEHAAWLAAVASRKFQVPHDDSKTLVQEVFLTYARSGSEVRDVRAWLVAGICNASRSYWRNRLRDEGRTSELRDTFPCPGAGTEESIALSMALSKMLSYLQEQCRDTLRMHYFEGRTAAEIARILATTDRYAEKLIHKCLQRARGLCEKLGVLL